MAVFTGLVEELAKVEHIQVTADGAQLRLAAEQILEDMKLGDSIAVNGVCLTVVQITGGAFVVEAVPETLRRTNLGQLHQGDKVHVERAMAADGRFGGHIVSGHIDGTGHIAEVRKDGYAQVLTIATAPALCRYIVEKGSICVDGVSLTVMTVDVDKFTISMIPHTQGVTRLGAARVGDMVNLECDVIAKYVERLLQIPQAAMTKSRADDLSLSFLQEHGFA